MTVRANPKTAIGTYTRHQEDWIHLCSECHKPLETGDLTISTDWEDYEGEWSDGMGAHLTCMGEFQKENYLDTLEDEVRCWETHGKTPAQLEEEYQKSVHRAWIAEREERGRVRAERNRAHRRASRAVWVDGLNRAFRKVRERVA